MNTLYREFVLDNEQRWNAAKSFIEYNYKPLAASDTQLRLIVTTQQEKRRAEQNKYYWSVVIKSIADQAWLEGRQFSGEVWHEQMARKFGIMKELILPDGDVVMKRLSTTEMSVKEFSKYTEEVAAWAVHELGIRFPSNVC